MKESKVLSGFEPTAVRGKWFAVNDLNAFNNFEEYMSR
jgi:hypothetical protein